jgi:hypothetical protein
VAEHKEKWMAQRNPDKHAKTEYRRRNAQANGVQIQDTEKLWKGGPVMLSSLTDQYGQMGQKPSNGNVRTSVVSDMLLCLWHKQKKNNSIICTNKCTKTVFSRFSLL